MKKFNWFKAVIEILVLFGIFYILYFGFKMLYHAWSV